MAYTAKEQSLILYLRKVGVGDYPTIVLTNDDIGKNYYIDGVLTTVTQQHVGGIAMDANKMVWTDDELYNHLNSARIQVFKGKVANFEAMDEFAQECITLKAQILLLKELAITSSKYARYSIGETTAEKLSPTELLDMVNSLEKMLKDMLNEGGSGASNMGAIVEEYQYQRFSKLHDIFVPTKLDNRPNNIPFQLQVVPGTGIYIYVTKIMIPKYYTHYLYKGIEPSAGSLVDQWYSLTDFTILDEDVLDGVNYRYTMYVEDINGLTNEHFKNATYDDGA